MARRPRASRLETRTARLKLPARQKPYDFTTLSPGIALGYRRNHAAGTGSCASPMARRQLDQARRPRRRLRRRRRRACPDLVAGDRERRASSPAARRYRPPGNGR